MGALPFRSSLSSAPGRISQPRPSRGASPMVASRPHIGRRPGASRRVVGVTLDREVEPIGPGRRRPLRVGLRRHRANARLSGRRVRRAMASRATYQSPDVRPRIISTVRGWRRAPPWLSSLRRRDLVVGLQPDGQVLVGHQGTSLVQRCVGVPFHSGMAARRRRGSRCGGRQRHGPAPPVADRTGSATPSPAWPGSHAGGCLPPARSTPRPAP